MVATVSIFRYEHLKSSKIVKPLNFEFTLNLKNVLPRFIKNDLQYDLYAFILHIGTGVERGHYQCYARSLEENPMLWYKFDDHYVTEQEITRSADFHFGYPSLNLVKIRPPTCSSTPVPTRAGPA